MLSPPSAALNHWRMVCGSWPREDNSKSSPAAVAGLVTGAAVFGCFPFVVISHPSERNFLCLSNYWYLNLSSGPASVGTQDMLIPLFFFFLLPFCGGIQQIATGETHIRYHQLLGKRPKHKLQSCGLTLYFFFIFLPTTPKQHTHVEYVGIYDEYFIVYLLGTRRGTML